MFKSAAVRRSRRRKVAFGAAIFGVVVAGLLLWRSAPEEPRADPESPVERSSVADPSSAVVEPPSTPVAVVPVPAPAPTYDGRLRPAEVFGNLECSLALGRGAAAGTAVVAVPHGPATRFSVVDGEGAVFGGEVPFRANQLRLGMREDGTPLVGLGALRLNSKKFRPMDSPEPVRIHLGEQVIYESDKVFDFLVARDASSFAVHEPVGAGSRLVVRNLELGEERHFDLGTQMRSNDAYESAHAMNYTLDGKQVVFEPAHGDAWGRGNHYFYPVGEGRSQRITVKDVFSALLVSSGEGYFVEPPEENPRGGVWRVTKRRMDARMGAVEDVWHSTLDLTDFDGRLSISDDGRWLGVHGWDFEVLDTSTGRVVFEYPTAGQAERQMAMLASVIGDEPSRAAIGDLTNITFRDGQMWFLRHFGSHDCHTPPGEEYDDVRYRQCVRDHRLQGRYRTVYDVYDLDTLAPESQPMYRAEVYRETNCMPGMPGDFPLRGLRDVAGTLTYLAQAG